MYDIDRAIRRLELAQRIDELQRQKAATAEQGLSVDLIATPDADADTGADTGSDAAAIPVPVASAAALMASVPTRGGVGPQPMPKFELAAPSVVAQPAATPPAATSPAATPTAVAQPGAAPAAQAVVVTKAGPPAAPGGAPAPGRGAPLPLRDTGSPGVDPVDPLDPVPEATPMTSPGLNGSAEEQGEPSGEALIGAALLAERLPQEHVNNKRWAEALEEHLTRTAEGTPSAPVTGVEGLRDSPSAELVATELPATPPVPESGAEPGRNGVEPGLGAAQQQREAPRPLLPRAVAPMPLASWATPPGGPGSDTGTSVGPLSRGAPDRPRPSTSDLLPRAVVPLTSASRVQPARHTLGTDLPDARTGHVDGFGAGGIPRDPALAPATGVTTDIPTDPATDLSTGSAGSADEDVAGRPAAEPDQAARPSAPVEQVDPAEQGDPAEPVEPVVAVDDVPGRPGADGDDPGEPGAPTTDGSGLTAATIIADLLRHGNRSLLR